MRLIKSVLATTSLLISLLVSPVFTGHVGASHARFPWVTFPEAENAIVDSEVVYCISPDGSPEPVGKFLLDGNPHGYIVYLARTGRIVVVFYENKQGTKPLEVAVAQGNPQDPNKIPELRFLPFDAAIHGEGPCDLLYPAADSKKGNRT